MYSVGIARAPQSIEESSTTVTGGLGMERLTWPIPVVRRLRFVEGECSSVALATGSMSLLPPLSGNGEYESDTMAVLPLSAYAGLENRALSNNF